MAIPPLIIPEKIVNCTRMAIYPEISQLIRARIKSSVFSLEPPIGNMLNIEILYFPSPGSAHLHSDEAHSLLCVRANGYNKIGGKWYQNAWRNGKTATRWINQPRIDEYCSGMAKVM